MNKIKSNPSYQAFEDLSTDVILAQYDTLKKSVRNRQQYESRHEARCQAQREELRLLERQYADLITRGQQSMIPKKDAKKIEKLKDSAYAQPDTRDTTQSARAAIIAVEAMLARPSSDNDTDSDDEGDEEQMIDDEAVENPLHADGLQIEHDELSMAGRELMNARLTARQAIDAALESQTQALNAFRDLCAKGLELVTLIVDRLKADVNNVNHQ